MDLQQAALAVCSAAALFVWYKRHRAISIKDIPGPKNPSWIHGHSWSWKHEEASVVEKSILEEYGSIARWKAACGEDSLIVFDPKAIHHILQDTTYLYEKPAVRGEFLSLVMDWGLVCVEGATHKRQRRAMTPAFGLVESKALYPHFTRCADSVVDKWHEILSNTEPERATVIDMHHWFEKAMLDAIGAGAFDYDFGAVEDADNKYTRSYRKLSFDLSRSLSKRNVFIMSFIRNWAPTGFIAWMFNMSKGPEMINIRENREYAHEVATKLIEEKRQELKNGTSRKDILSLLVKSNSAIRPEWRLNDEEIVSQFRTIVFAGHETTAKTLTFALWELAKNRHVQERLRAEIFETLANIRVGGGNEFTVDDFDSMPYLLVVVKETLRMYPVIIEVTRQPTKDDILPLSKPIVGISGKVYNEVLVPAGTSISISIVGYNLNKDVWGPDAYEFRPERWLEMNGKPETPVGVYGNLATFSGGNRGCIAWRFAIIELHTFLVTLVRQFDFSLPEDGREVRKIRPGLIMPVVVGEEHKGPQLFLKLTALSNE